jgi:hypothetical protein
VGLYGRVGDYNFVPFGTDGEGSHTGDYTEGGLSIGYTWPFAQHWILEGEVQGGYRHSAVETYHHVGVHQNYLHYTTPTNKVTMTGLFLNLGYRFK